MSEGNYSLKEMRTNITIASVESFSSFVGRKLLSERDENLTLLKNLKIKTRLCRKETTL